jgi:hypothetical protein
VGLTVGDGTNRLFVYPAQARSSGEFTQAVIEVTDVRVAVEEMRGRGVQFQEYDTPETRTEGGIAQMPGGGEGASFKTPKATWSASFPLRPPDTAVEIDGPARITGRVPTALDDPRGSDPPRWLVAYRGVQLELERGGLKRLARRSRPSSLGPVGHHIVGSAAPVADPPVKRLDREAA